MCYLPFIVSNIFVATCEWINGEFKNPKKLFIRPSLSKDIFSGFFDGAQMNGWCGVGMAIYLRRNHIIKLKMGIGKGTNIVAGLVSLWGFL